MGNEMRIIGPKRVNHCPAVARVCTASQVGWWNVAGGVANCRRSGGETLQVCVFGVTCDGNQPLGQKSVAGPNFFSDLRHFG